MEASCIHCGGQNRGEVRTDQRLDARVRLNHQAAAHVRERANELRRHRDLSERLVGLSESRVFRHPVGGGRTRLPRNRDVAAQARQHRGAEGVHDHAITQNLDERATEEVRANEVAASRCRANREVTILHIHRQEEATSFAAQLRRDGLRGFTLEAGLRPVARGSGVDGAAEAVAARLRLAHAEVGSRVLERLRADLIEQGAAESVEAHAVVDGLLSQSALAVTGAEFEDGGHAAALLAGCIGGSVRQFNAHL